MPPRIPRHLWVLPWASGHFPDKLAEIQKTFPDDITTAPAFLKQQPKTSGDPYEIGTYGEEWGCTYEKKQAGVIGRIKQPLVRTWDELSKVKIPQQLLTIDTDKINNFCRNTDRFVLAGCCPRPFERLQFIRGTENVMMALALRQEELFTLLERIHQFYIRQLELWAQTDVDALWFMDDWGAQSSLLLSPRMWRDVFKPLYKDYIDIAHSRGRKAFMHSDGCITDIIPDLIELGLDALNSQIFCMGVEQLGRKFKGKITFWGGIDRQRLLPHATAQEIADAVKLVHSSLYRNGGVIAQMEFGPDAKPENVYTAFQTWNTLT